MSRWVAISVALMAAAVVVLATAAQPVRLWVVPPSGAEMSPLGGAPPGAEVAPRRPEVRSSSGGEIEFLPQVLAVLVAAGGIAAVVMMRGSWPDHWPSGALGSRRFRRFGSLPEAALGDPGVDIEAARAALSTGQPRNAIVACWMRLESDIAAAGWPRSAAETSAEYVARIVAAASVDSSAISDLAALYREARFSDHPLVDADRTDALTALARIEAGLRSSAGVPA